MLKTRTKHLKFLCHSREKLLVKYWARIMPEIQWKRYSLVAMQPPEIFEPAHIVIWKIIEKQEQLNKWIIKSSAVMWQSCQWLVCANFSPKPYLSIVATSTIANSLDCGIKERDSFLSSSSCDLSHDPEPKRNPRLLIRVIKIKELLSFNQRINTDLFQSLEKHRGDQTDGRDASVCQDEQVVEMWNRPQMCWRVLLALFA